MGESPSSTPSPDDLIEDTALLSPQSTPSKSSYNTTVYSSSNNKMVAPEETYSPRNTIGPIRTILSRSRPDISKLDHDSPRHRLDYGNSPSIEGRKHQQLRPKSEYYPPRDYTDSSPAFQRKVGYNNRSVEDVRGSGDDREEECDIVPFQRKESIPSNGE